jgi:hypothetical protein
MEIDDMKPILEALLQPLFPLGYVCATPGAKMCLADETINAALARHVRGDWGEMDEEDSLSNEEALIHGFRVFSAYRAEGTDLRFWIITEADRSVTTVLLPNEY